MPRHLSGDYLLRAAERARRPDREHMQSLKGRVPYWFVVILLSGFAAFQIMMNPFGFTPSTTDFCLTAAIGRWIAVQHGPGTGVQVGTLFTPGTCTVS